MITLTSAGRQAAENTKGSGPEYKVLSELYEVGGSMDIEEIMDATRMDVETARMVLNRLCSRKYIQEV